MLMTIVWLLVALIVLCLLWWAVTKILGVLPIPEPIKTVVTVVLVVIFVLILIYILLHALPVPVRVP